MKKYYLTPLYVVALFAIITLFGSCSKEMQSAPAAPQSSLTSNDASTSEDALTSGEALEAGEMVVAQVVPGTYTVTKFIDSGDPKTRQFRGYTFEFQANGTLIATTNTGAIFKGSWKLNTAETKMAINISGTAALNNLDDDSWRVVSITNINISLKKPGPDKVIFTMQ